jgi:probable rRNA maturation factor
MRRTSVHPDTRPSAASPSDVPGRSSDRSTNAATAVCLTDSQSSDDDGGSGNGSRQADDTEPGQPPASGSIELQITLSETGSEAHGSDVDLEIDVDAISGRIRLAFEQLGLTTGRVSVLLADDSEMSRLHAAYSGDDSPTDVLTFDSSDDTEDSFADFPELESSNDEDAAEGGMATGGGGPGTGRIDADIAVGRDVAKREAERRGHSISDEVLLYVIHGILHCVGYDDKSEDESQRMHRKEDEILSAIGIGPRFRRPGPGIESGNSSTDETKGERRPKS